MKLTMPISEARDQLTSLPEKLENGEEPATLMITRRGEPVLDVIPHAVFEGIMETLEILADPEALALLQKSARQSREGKTRSLAEVKKRLGF
jgi:PHD/YefM family antitoxin component YafN of YafNO toxin-antitoxin module